MHLLILCGCLAVVAAAPMLPPAEIQDDAEYEDTLTTAPPVVSRRKRQEAQHAMDLSISHTDHNGNIRPVGQIHSQVDMRGFYNNPNNHHIQAGLGLGSVIYRSPNGQHSVGVGAYGSHNQGKSSGYGYKPAPQWGTGVGYKFTF